MIAEAIANYETDRIHDQDLLQFLIGKGAEKMDIPINEAMRLEHSELVRKIGKRSATKLSAAFELARRAMSPRLRETQIKGPSDVYQFMKPRIAHLSRETFWTLLLDTKHHLVRAVQVAEGGLAACAISPRDVFEPAIREAAPVVLFVHNHPSGDPTPSEDDIQITQRIVKGAKVLGLTFLDHVIVGDQGYVSLAETGRV